jgi:predicted NACHT family NTPase
MGRSKRKMSMEILIEKGERVGLNASIMTKIYRYIQQDTKNIKAVYSQDFNESIAAIGRVEKVAQKYFTAQAEAVASLIVNAENEIMGLIKDMGWK